MPIYFFTALPVVILKLPKIFRIGMADSPTIKIFIKTPNDKLTEETKDRLGIEVSPDEKVSKVCLLLRV